MIHIGFKFAELYICFMNIYNIEQDEFYKKRAILRIGRSVLCTEQGFRRLEA